MSDAKMIDESDTEFQEQILDSVKEHPAGYELNHDGWTLWCPKAEGVPAPRAGETLRMYGRGIGYSVRGIVVNGRVYRYMTDEVAKARKEAESKEDELKREHALQASLADLNNRIAALPEVFRKRIEKFQRDGGHTFRRDYEGYELFCCEQAVLIADALGTVGNVRIFYAASLEDQKRMVPGMSTDHSGNTFGAACRLAQQYLESPERVPAIHGALTPLVGCEAYGCKHDTAHATA